MQGSTWSQPSKHRHRCQKFWRSLDILRTSDVFKCYLQKELSASIVAPMSAGLPTLLSGFNRRKEALSRWPTYRRALRSVIRSVRRHLSEHRSLFSAEFPPPLGIMCGSSGLASAFTLCFIYWVVPSAVGLFQYLVYSLLSFSFCGAMNKQPSHSWLKTIT